MRARLEILILSVCGVFCAATPGLANETFSATLSDQDLAITVTGASITIALRADLQNNQSSAHRIAAGRLQDFFGIETISANTGQNSVSQAGTSLTVRATLTMAGRAGLAF
jgi:hypothetical protein